MRAAQLILLLIVSLGINTIQAQQGSSILSNQRAKYVKPSLKHTTIDTSSIVPRSLTVVGIPDSLIEVDWANASIRFLQLPVFDSVLIRYRVFPGKLTAIANHMNYDSVMNNFMAQPFVPNFGSDDKDSRFFNFGNINYNGSFGRGLSFGNSQDAVVTSNLNLQLSGYLADSIEITAAITDNNIPIQPDGNTQQLNEFDRIFLQFKKERWQLSLGDIDIRQQQSYFLSFYKRLQGAAFETTNPVGKNATNKTIVSGSVAKGKFTRNVFQGLEGNQGPYRLTGANNEFYFVVLANTERVFIDGELMQRGEDQDYVINYNTAEITFMPKRMITKDKRIQVEFEYADRNYLNANIYLANELSFGKKGAFRMGYFANSDAKNSPINQTLDPAQKNFLAQLGDSVQNAFYPNAVLDTFASGRIFYKKIDTVYNGGASRDSIYVYSTNADSAKYTLSFINVGEGKGNYMPDFNGANGKVYKWIEPINGVKQGQYEPAVFLVSPKRTQVLSLGGDYQFSKTTQLIVEGAMSKYDVNLFSSKDKSDNTGLATKWQLKNQFPIKGTQRKLTADIGYEWVSHRFKPLERLRNVEFTRDWGLPLQQTIPVDEQILTAAVGIQDNKTGTVKLQSTQYTRGDGFKGWKQSLQQSQSLKEWRLNNTVSYASVDLPMYKGYFWRPSLQISRTFKKLSNYTISGSYNLERNDIRSKQTDSVSVQSFSFETIQLGFRSDDSKANKWGISYFTRTDAYPLGKGLLRADRSQNYQFNAELLKSEAHQFRMSATYRSLSIIKDGITGLKADNSLLSRTEYAANILKGMITGNLLYEIGAGQEQKRDLAYLEVPAGQGVYTWIDYNNDGIQQLNEFEEAAFADQRKYILIFTPTNEYIKANYNNFNYQFSLNPRNAIDPLNAKGFKKFISKINLQSSYQVSKKAKSNGDLSFDPFSAKLNDTSLIVLNSVFANSFSFNRFSTKWGFDINSVKTSNKSLLTYGYESREVQDWTTRARWIINKTFTIDGTGRWGYNRLVSSNPKFGNRNYNIDLYSIEPRLSIIRKSNLRIAASYKYANKKNSVGDQERAVSNAIISEIKYTILQKTSIQGKFTYNSIDFSSNASPVNLNAPSAYIMLDGLTPGKNYLWSIDLTKRLSNSLEMNIQYEGRQPGTGRVVHIGRAGIKAIL